MRGLGAVSMGFSVHYIPLSSGVAAISGVITTRVAVVGIGLNMNSCAVLLLVDVVVAWLTHEWRSQNWTPEEYWTSLSHRVFAPLLENHQKLCPERELRGFHGSRTVRDRASTNKR